jgi:cyclase
MRRPVGFMRVAGLLLTGSSLAAQPRTADPAARGLALSAFPRVIRLADNVYGYEEIRQPGFTTVSVFVVGKNGVLVADGQGSPQATQRMVEEIRNVTPLPIRWYVVGSDHGDHTAGNAVLPPGITYVVHPTSLAQLKRDSASAVAANARAAGEAQAKGTAAPPPRVVVVPPGAMRGDTAIIDVGGIEVQALFLGRAHTGGDLMVWLPREKILFMSEAYLNRVFPAMRSAYPSEWVRTIDRALAMNATHYIPGHGFIESGPVSREELVTYRKALVDVIAEVKRLRDAGFSAEQAINLARWGDYATWFLADQQAPIAVRKIYEELEGKLK